MADLRSRVAALSPVKRELLRERFRRPDRADLPPGQPPAPAIPRRTGEGPVRLSSAQERLWFLDRLQPGSAAYNLVYAVRLLGRLDVAVLTAAFGQLLRRHESLRTVFVESAGVPYQVVLPVVSTGAEPVVLIDLSALPEPARRTAGEDAALAEGRRPFDLGAGPLLRIRLLRLGGEEHLLVVVLHHIVADLWSWGVLVAELAAAYSRLDAGEPAEPPSPAIQYADFALWQREWLAGPACQDQLAYWRGQLAGASGVLELPADRPPPAARRSTGGLVRFALPAELSHGLHALGQSTGTTLFMVAWAVFAALLQRHSGQDDVLVGSPIAGRNLQELEPLIGLFVNTLVLRADLSDDPPFLELLGRVRATTLGAFAHQDLPFDKLVEDLHPERNTARPPLVQVMFALHNAEVLSPAVHGLQIAPYAVDTGTAKLDLSLDLLERQGELAGAVEYDAELFDRARIQRFAGHWRQVLAAVVEEPGRRVSDLPLLAPAERHQLLLEWNDRAADYPRGLSLHGLFEAQAERTPDAAAVRAEAGVLTYRELDRASDRWARWLRRQGAGAETVVGVLLERSPDLVVALLGVLKAGAAYLPLDPGYPPERLRMLVADAAPRLVLTAGAWAGLAPEECRTVLLDAGSALLDGCSGERAGAVVHPDSLGYVIYTSGSTGRPKGVMSSHRGVVNRLLEAQETHGLGADDRVLQVTSFSFDASILEIFWPLAVGASVVLAPPDGQRDPDGLAELIARERVTTLNLVPSLLRALLAADAVEWCTALRRILVGGEELTAEILASAGARLAWAEVHNVYGPTEASIDAAAWPCRRGGPGAGVPIGRPLANLAVHLLDRRRQPVPIGVPGELQIGGVAVGRGYLGRPERTADVFVPDPFASEPGARLYRTGDLARHRPDGAIDFLGRLDRQVKVRGFRIELGEIEDRLQRIAEVGQAVVAVREDRPGDRVLVAYAVPRPGARLAWSEVRGELARGLPEHMLPSALVVLEALPLTPSGKIDRRALPAPDRGADPAPRTAPRTPVEELVAAVWAEVLEVGRVGVEESFFALGGHSLLATRVVSRLRAAFGVEVPLRRFFEAPTVAGLAAVLTEERGDAAPPLAARPRPASLPLSFAQERLWFLHRLDPGSSAYHIPAAIDLEGELQEGALGRALAEVVRRHEALRTTFAAGADDPRQIVSPPGGWQLPVVDLAALPAAARAAEARRLAQSEAVRPFDLEAGPLVRACLLRRDGSGWTLLLTMHHIVSDGWSAEVLLREVAALYAAAAAGLSSPLPELAVQYADYALWQREWLAGEALERQLAHWRRALAGAPFVLEIPADRPRPAVQRFRARTWSHRLPRPATAVLYALGRSLAATPFMLVLSLFHLLLARWTGRDDLLVGSPVANRERAETEGLIGFFVNTLVLRGDLAGDPSFAEAVARGRRTVLEAVAHQDLPFEKLVAELQPDRHLAASPLFQTLLVWQGTPAVLPPLPGLRLAPWPETGEIGGTGAKFDLTLTWSRAVEEGDAVSWEVDADLFDRATAARMAGQLEALLAAAVATPEARGSLLSLLTPGERQQLLVEWGSGDPVASPTVTLHGLIEAQAKRTPGAPALVAGGERLTYAELDRRAGGVARRLLSAGVGPEARVGVLAERSAALVAALLGVLKAGGAYVPVDPAHPRERQAFLLADAGVRVLLAARGDAAAAELAATGTGAEIALLDLDEAGDPDASPRERAGQTGPGHLGAQAGNLAYLIYTSGSTGRPKGVAIEHRSAAARVAWALQAYSPEELAGVLFATSIGFDLSVFELFVPLSAGGCVILARNALELTALPAAGEVRLVNTVPSAMAELVRSGALPAGVRTVNLAGEPLGRALVDRIHACGTVERLYNLYGPSEDTTYSTFARVHAGDRREPSIGRPLPGTRAHVLDRHLQPVPAGVPGELHLAGEGLARGYLDRPGLTAERFLPDPFGLAGERLYRTGDLARWRPDGFLEFLGRLDHQVKIRGFRIELGEIEAALAQVPGVEGAAAGVREVAGDRQLVAYLSADGAAVPPRGALRELLRARLPEVMIPAAFVLLDALPLNANGKVDRKVLDGIPLDREGREDPAGEGFRTLTEELVAGIWCEVLGIERIGPRASFFDLGGHSLLATRVAARVREACGVELPLRALFESPTVAELALRIEELAQGGRPAAQPPLLPVSRRDPLPLSFAQERLWFLHRLDSASPAYNMPLPLLLRGELDEAAFAAAWGEVVRRHEILRATFTVVEGRPAQSFAPVSVGNRAGNLALADLSGLPVGHRRAEVSRLIRDESARPFDLARGVLRAVLLRLGTGATGADERVLLLDLHHIAADGWSLGVLVRDAAAVYAAFCRGKASPLPGPALQYADFAVWQRGWLQGPVLDEHLAYWQERLRDAPAVLALPADRPRPAVQSLRGDLVSFALPGALAGRLQLLARRQGTTLFATLMAAFQVLLARLSGQRDLCVGAPLAGRQRRETEDLVGLFVNVLALRADLAGAPSFQEALRRTHEALLGALAHQDLPLERLVDELRIERSLSWPPLVQVVLALQNLPDAAVRLDGLDLEPLPVPAVAAKFDLALALSGGAEGLAGSAEFAADLFERTTVLRWLGHFRNLLEALAGDPAQSCESAPLLSAAERHHLLAEWNDTAVRCGPFRPVHERFAARAAAVPDAPAVASSGAVLTYGELHARAERLARLLQTLGVGPESLVALCLQRSPELIVACLGVLLAGGAYAPLDPGAPGERLAFMIDDAGAAVLITREEQARALPAVAARVLCLDGALPDPGPSALPVAAEPRQLAYLIYTSGSTGRPKGVAVTHQGLANLVDWHCAAYGLTAADRVPQVASPAFDASVWEIWPPLTAGACLQLADEAARTDPGRLAGWLAETGAAAAFAPTPIAEPLLAAAWPEPLALRVLLTGGDALRRRPPAGAGFRLVNHYGPTENSVVSTAGTVAPALPGAAAGHPPGIGRPIANVRVYLADLALEPVPPGAAGELLIGGDGLARGYRGRPDLTAERFVPDPWSGEPGARLYRSGDLARWLDRGDLLFLGRVDRQVKVLGVRIELEEIEAALLAQPGVREAVVEAVASGAGERRLAAWVVLDPGSGASPDGLRAALGQRLPAAMVPAVFRVLDALPLTANGKLDRKALAALPPESGQEPGADEPHDPQQPLQSLLAGIWAEVLERPRVGLRQGFFDLGGHSLLATRAVSRIAAALGVEVPLRLLFEHPTLERFAAAVEELLLGGGRPAPPPLVRVPRDAPLPLSFAQERLWFLDRLEPGSAAYNVPGALRVAGGLDPAALAATLTAIAGRHEVLRTVFEDDGHGPRQRVLPPAPVELPEVDLSGLAAARREAEVRALTAAEVARPFDLSRGPLLRAAVLRLAAAEHAVLWNLHHIASDGWSTAVFGRELAALYPAFAARRPAALPELPVQYGDFAVWQRRWLAGGELARQLGYWRERLAGVPPVLELPADRPRPTLARRRPAHRGVALGPRLSGALRELGRRARTTPFMTLLAGFQLLLHRLSGQDDLCVGTPVAGRRSSDLEGLIGFFVNTLALRSRLAGDLTGAVLLAGVRESTLASFGHQDLPFERLVEELQPERSRSHAPLFQALFTLQNTPGAALELPGLVCTPLEVGSGGAKFDLLLTCWEQDGEIAGRLEWNADLLDAATAGRWQGALASLLGALAGDPGRPCSGLPLLSPGQRHQLLREWTPAPDGRPAGGCLHELVATRAASAPDATALVAGETVLTYGELDHLARRLARRLRARGVGPDATVGLCTERSVEMVVGMLGTLRAGGAYVPLDPAAPAAHLALILDEMRPGVVLAQQASAPRLPVPAVDLLLLDAPDPAGEEEEEAAPEITGATPENLAYVIYTSGSTGRPKGVMQTHRAVTHHLLARQVLQPLRPGDAFLQQAAFSFEMSAWEVFWPLIAGARLVLARPGGQRDTAYLVETIVQRDIHALRFTPSLLALIAEQDGVERCRALRHVHTGAEPLSPELAGRVERLLPGVTVHHHYGPTEACIAATLFTGGLRPSHPKLPIGRSFADADLFVADRAAIGARPVPPGVVGELYIGGPGLARGYLGRPDLTAERFLPHPWSELPGRRLYRTGDLVRWLPDGNLDFVGRTDHQVKIRGYRVELGEVEAALAALPGVAQAAAVARVWKGELQLVGYAMPAPGATPRAAIDADELRAALRQRLPEPLVPSAVVLLPELPLTPNGKVDRRALPLPEEPRGAGAGAAPRTPAEELVAGIWAEVLGLDAVGVDQSFFDLGGHSLLAIQVISRLTRVFGVEVPLDRLFASPTPAGLAAAVEEARARGPRTAAPPLVPADRSRPLPLSFAQERLWFLDRLAPGSASYNIPASLRVNGALDLAALAWSLGEIVRRHEVLRTRFDAVDGQPVQVIGPASGLALPLVDLSGLGEGEAGEARRLAAAEAERAFDLARGPLVRATALRLAAGSHVLLLTLHHAVADGWSIGVLVRELGELYPAAVAGAASPLPEPRLQYADFALWQRRRLAGEALDGLLAFWRGRLAGAAPVLPLPTDRPRAAGGPRRAGLRTSSPAPGLAPSLRELGRREAATPFMVLLAAFQALLFRTGGQGDVSVGIPTAGRGRLELEGLIGLFVNTLVMRSTFDAATPFRALLQQVREAVLAGHAHQDLPFERLVEELQPVRSLTHTPLFQVLLNVQSGPRTALELPGLRVEPFGAEPGSNKLDLNLAVSDAGESLALGLSFDSGLFDASTAARLLACFETLLGAAAAAPEQAVGELPLLAPAARHQVVVEWGEAARPPAPAPVLRRIGGHAALAPDAVAVVCEDRHLTYGELARRSAGLAARLRELGVGPESTVGICAERSEAMVVALLGVWRASGAYVPLDPSFPAPRLAAMLESSAAGAVLAERHLLGLVAGPAARCVLVLEDSCGPAAAGLGDGGTLPGNLAYVLYTSGSTGRPKGVAVEHRQLAHYTAAALERLDLALDLAHPASFATVSTLAADLGHTSLFPALASGGTLHVIAAGRAADPEAMAEYMEQRQVEVLKIVPSHLRALRTARRPAAVLPRLRLVLGGEALPWAEAEAVRELAPGCTVLNHYGPTESTVGVLTHRLAGGEPRRGTTVPLGRPLSRVRCAVVDPAGQPVPPGVAGELRLGGAGVARGYLGRPEQTAERFVPDPFSGLPGERLYRTGDLVRHLADGRLEFLGRIDHQVKVRGYRMELGEIEVALAALPGVAQAVAVARERRGELQLVGYVVPEPLASLDLEDLRAALRRTLPEPLVPAALVVLAELPLTANGKVDRGALAPLAQPAEPGAAAGHVEPRSEIERDLAGIWAELLGVERIGVHDDFFALGGHSLLAMRLLSRVRQRFGAEVPLRALFEAPTVAGVALRLAQAAPLPESDVPPLAPSSLRDLWPSAGLPLPCSFAQRRLWFLQQLHPASTAYNVPAALELDGDLAPVVLQAALGEVVRRHEVLRTTFRLAEGEPVQVVAPPAPVPLPLIDLAALPAAAGAAELAHRLAAEGNRPFDLATGPLLRAGLLRLAPRRHVLLLTLHHIVSDGWSRGLLFDEVAALYAALRAGRPSPLAELPLQYGDFADWQQRWLTGERLAAQVELWRARLAGAPPQLELPTDRPRPPVRSERGARRPVALALPPPLESRLRTLVRSERATPFAVLLTAFQALLSRLAGQTDVCVGTQIAGRQRAELERLIGLFLNTLVLRADLADDPPFRLALARNRDALLEANAHQDVPFEKLVEELRPARNLASTPFFQAMLVFQSFPRGGDQLLGLTLRPLDVERGTAKVDLLLGVEETAGGFAGGLEYAADLFDGATLERLHRQLGRLLAGAVADPDRRLSELPLSSAPERHQLVTEWNDTLRGYELDRPLPAWLAAQAVRAPDAVALVSGEAQLTRGELAARAGRLAAHLRVLGVGPEVPVGLCAERSAEMVVALLGILQAGGAYVPLDPEYPADRLAFMLSDAQAPVLLVQEHLLAGLPEPPAGTRVVGLGAALARAEAAGPAASGGGTHAGYRADLGADNLAYVIYTSGSTGRPKGAMNPHRGVVNRLLWMQEAYGLGPADRVLQKTPFSFDVSVWEFFWPLMVGAPLVLARPGGHRDPGYLVELMAEQEVTTAHFVPSMLQVFVEAPGLERCRSLRRVVASGEALPSDLVARFLARLGAGGVELHNLYGPTEAAVDVTAERCGEEPAAGAVAIGRPIANCRILLLDPAGREVPMGAAGELTIGGVQVARGYWRRPALTAERFVPDPTSPAPGARLYRTGDLARQRADGAIEYLGRLDHQVKLRGFRIELGEIEAALAGRPEVREAVVAAHGQGLDLRLVAYVVPAAGCEVTDPSLQAAALQAALRRTLPEPLVPSAVVVLPELPLNPNGKVDRRALPAPASNGAAAGAPEHGAAPRSELERALARLWSELLRVPDVRLGDDFFALGGHSLLAALLAARVQRDLGLQLPVATVFQAPTLEALAARLAGVSGVAGVAGAPGPVAVRSPRPLRLVCLQDGGPAPPLVLVHPVGGDVACYAELARRLGPEQAVWGLRAVGLDAGEEPRESLEELAEDHLAALRELAPRGPYRLAGWSLGGVVAFEMARRLVAEGETVEILALLDSRAPGVLPAVPPKDAALLAGLAHDLSGLSGRPVALAEERLKQLPVEARLGALLAAAVAAGALPAGLDEEAAARLWRVYRANMRAARAYRGGPYPGRLLVVAAGRNPATLARGWDPFAPDLEAAAVDADHYSLVRPPAVDALAAHLRDRLAKLLP